MAEGDTIKDTDLPGLGETETRNGPQASPAGRFRSVSSVGVYCGAAPAMIKTPRSGCRYFWVAAST